MDRSLQSAEAAILPRVSAENVEVVRRFLAALSASPDEVRASIAEFWDPDADYYPVRKFPDAQPCHGREEVSQFLARYLDAYFRTEWEIQELIEVGDDRVLTHVNLRAEGRGSGMKLEGDLYRCFWLRHGRFFRMEDHVTLRGALRALGLQGETLEAAGLRAPTNLDLVRSILAAWERGDVSSAEWAHPDIEFVLADGPAPGTATGLAGMAKMMRDFLELWEEWSVQADEYRELDDERILVLQHYNARGKTSGLELDQIGARGANLFHIRGGKVIRLACYLDRNRALADLHLAPEIGSSAS